MSDDAEYHRTFERFSANKLGMWPEFKHSKRRWDYRGEAYYRKEYEEAYAKRVGAFNAYIRAGDGVQPIRLMPKHDQQFWKYATEWEDKNSALTATWMHRVEPVVDDQLKVVGHYGSWWANEILIPKGASGSDLNALLSSGIPIFANPANPIPSYYDTLRDRQGVPMWKYLLLTAPDGAVESSFLADVGRGAVATMAPWEAISIGRSAVALVGTGRRYLVSMISRRGAARNVAAGPTKELAEKAAASAAPPPIPVQARKVTQADMIAWEREGLAWGQKEGLGHGLRQHGPQHTRETLKKRVTGGEEIPAPQIQPGGVKPADFRVWRGDKVPAASKFASDEVMRKAIGDVTHKNLAEIRRVTSNGGEVILSKQAVGYKTGEGWVTAAGPGATRTMFYDTKLQRVTLVIRRRKNHVPTKEDPEGWYVHTAFPEK